MTPNNNNDNNNNDFWKQIQFTEQRKIDMENNTILRYEAYNKMIMIGTTTLVITLALLLIHKVFPVIPSSLIYSFIGLVLFVAMMWETILVVTMIYRSNTDYTKLSLSNIPVSSSSSVGKSTTSVNLLGTGVSGSLNKVSTVGSCVGAQCCSNITQWNSVLGQCMSNYTPS